VNGIIIKSKSGVNGMIQINWNQKHDTYLEVCKQLFGYRINRLLSLDIKTLDVVVGKVDCCLFEAV